MDTDQLEKRTLLVQGVWFLPVWLRHSDERMHRGLKLNDYQHCSPIWRESNCPNYRAGRILMRGRLAPLPYHQWGTRIKTRIKTRIR